MRADPSPTLEFISRRGPPTQANLALDRPGANIGRRGQAKVGGRRLDKVLRETGDRTAASEEMDEPLGKPHDEYAQPVDGTLEQDGLDLRRTVETAH